MYGELHHFCSIPKFVTPAVESASQKRISRASLLVIRSQLPQLIHSQLNRSQLNHRHRRRLAPPPQVETIERIAFLLRMPLRLDLPVDNGLKRARLDEGRNLFP
jgi:hypothetical protein